MIMAASPSATAIECCGLYQMDRGSPSMVSPSNHHLVIASILSSFSGAKEPALRQVRTAAYRPSALDAISVNPVAAAATNPRGTSTQAARKIALTNRCAVQMPLTLRKASTGAGGPGEA